MDIVAQQIDQKVAPAPVVELAEFELALIGGGIGDVILG
jgi:hypothetical protein